MSLQPGLPPLAAAAMQQKRYVEAIPLLESFCLAAATPSKDYFQAQMWLVKAYRETGQLEQAIDLCQQMTTTAHPKIQAWARQALAALTAPPSVPDLASPQAAIPKPPPQPAPTLDSAAAAALLEAGNKALKRGDYSEAVEQLEAYCAGADRSEKNYEQGQSWLAKAYKGNGQRDQAIAICQTLIHSDKPFIKIWAEQFLQSIAPEVAQALKAEPGEAESGAPSNSSSDPSRSQSVSSRQSGSSTAKASMPKAGRSTKRGVALMMKGVAS
ncbi:MAG TPA: tetratricopeptide repeat protein, partial [Allocoleopsis sp.]